MDTFPCLHESFMRFSVIVSRGKCIQSVSLKRRTATLLTSSWLLTVGTAKRAAASLGTLAIKVNLVRHRCWNPLLDFEKQ